MKLDRRAIALISSLDDAQLRFVITNVAQNMGINIDSLGLNTHDVNKLRKRLAELTDEEIAEAQRQINDGQVKRNGQ